MVIPVEEPLPWEASCWLSDGGVTSLALLSADSFQLFCLIAVTDVDTSGVSWWRLIRRSGEPALLLMRRLPDRYFFQGFERNACAISLL